MIRVIRLFNDLLDKLLALVFISVMLIGVWFVYDTAYVFYHASADRVAAYRPGSAEAAAAPKQLTKDYVAWLHVDNTSIEYPIMQGKNNSEYLNKDPYGDYSLAGSIFLDSRNAPDFSDSYCLTYGHHMTGGLMFGALDDYLKEKFFWEHRTGTLTIQRLTDKDEPVENNTEILNEETTVSAAEGKEIPFTVFAVLETDASESVLFQPQGSAGVLALASAKAKYYAEPKSTHVLALTTCVDAVHTTRTVVLCALEGEME